MAAESRCRIGACASFSVALPEANRSRASIVTVVFPLAFAVQGLYRIRPTRSRAEEWLSVGVGTVVATIILSGVLLWVRIGSPDTHYSRATLALFIVLAMVFVMAGRTLVRSFVERRHRAGKDLDRVLIAGNRNSGL